MSCLAILLTSALLAQSTSDDGQIPKAGLPPVPGKSQPVASGEAKKRENQATDPLPTAPLGQSLEELFRAQNPKEFDGAVARGRAEADEDLKAGQAKIRQSGMVINLDCIDRETGLYYSGFGCVLDATIIGRVAGYNARVEESIREHGLPRNSLKPWEKELFAPKDYFESRSQTEKPIRLILDGPGVRAPDGKTVLKLVRYVLELPPPSPSSDPAVRAKGEQFEVACLLVGDTKPEDGWLIFPRFDLELVWGPQDSWFAVVKGRRRWDSLVRYTAIDLQARRTIHEEDPRK